MKLKNKIIFDSQSGQASKLLLVLAIVVLVAAILTFLIMRMAEPPVKPAPIEEPGVELPVYEKQLGNIRFKYISALDRGGVLRLSEVLNPQYSSQKELTTGEKFIQVTIGAQNMGTFNTEPNAWGIENLVDSDNREFVPLEGYSVGPWLPKENFCGALLKPAFDPAPCTKIYEVSKNSTGFKIRIETGKDNSANNFSSGKIDSFLLDLIVK